MSQPIAAEFESGPAPEAGGRIDETELAAWLRLTLTPGVGRVLGRRLLGAFGLPQAVLAAGHARLSAHMPATLASRLLASPDAALRAAVHRTIAWLAGNGNGILTLADPAYPRGLLDLADPPLVLYVRGNPACLGRPGLAMVGSRNASVQGGRDAETFGAAFSRAGLAVVSGLALGIDAAAHAGGLRGEGATVAVVGTGLDVVYPARHAALAARIAAHGAMVSEFPLGTPARSHHFPQRNRIIAAMSRGVLVVEAARQSGSLITAHQAAALGREVFAIPGSIHAPMAKGCHQLIREGACLVECAADVLDALGLPPAGAATLPGDQDSASRARPDPPAPPAPADPLGAALAFDPVSLDALCGLTGMPVHAVSAALLELEIRGCVERLAGDRYRRLGGAS